MSTGGDLPRNDDDIALGPVCQRGRNRPGMVGCPLWHNGPSLVIPRVVAGVHLPFVAAFTADSLLPSFVSLPPFPLFLFSFSTDDHTWLTPSPPSPPSFPPPHWPHPLRSAMDMVGETEGRTAHAQRDSLLWG